MRLPSSRSVCAAALVGLAAVVACSKDTTGPGPTVAAINIAAGSDTLAALGRTRQFSATATDASGHPVTGGMAILFGEARGPAEQRQQRGHAQRIVAPPAQPRDPGCQGARRLS